MIRPLKNTILFAFVDNTADGMFVEKTKSGLMLAKSHDRSAKLPRWGKIIACGPDVDKEIKNAHQILVEPLMWTEGVEYDGVRIWKTDSTKIMAVQDKQ